MCLTASTIVVVTVNYFTSLLESDHIDTKIKYQTVLISSFHTIKYANNLNSWFSGILLLVENPYTHSIQF